MYTVFIIGNLASGKSTAARYLADHGGRLIDLDRMAKQLYQPGSLIVDALVEAFGRRVRTAEGGIDTKELAACAFATPEATASLNGIVHPVVLQKLGDQLVGPCGCCVTEPDVPFTVVEISVADAFTEAFPLADEIIAITAPLEERRRRAIERGMTAADFDRRAAVQPTEERLCALATRVIDNTVADDRLFRALDAWMQERGFMDGPGAAQATLFDESAPHHG